MDLVLLLYNCSRWPLMAKILDCAVAPTNKAEKHRSRRIERREPGGDLILERGKEEEEMSFRQREHKR